MDKQNFVYVDANYLKELEETAKKVDYYKGIIDGINMVIDRKTENCSEKPNNFDKDINVRSKDEPTTQTETQNSNLTFEKDECAKEYEELGLKELKELIKADRKDEPQTYVINPQEPTNDEKCFECDDFFTCGGQCNKIEDEPQTEPLKQVKYFDEDEKVWKMGSVIVNE